MTERRVNKASELFLCLGVVGATLEHGPEKAAIINMVANVSTETAARLYDLIRQKD